MRIGNRPTLQEETIHAGTLNRARRRLFSLLKISLRVAVLMLLTVNSRAQVSTGDILGNVTDSSGNALQGAKIVLTNTQTHETHTVKQIVRANTSYPPATGSLFTSVSAAGFRPYRVDDITLE